MRRHVEEIEYLMTRNSYVMISPKLIIGKKFLHLSIHELIKTINIQQSLHSFTRIYMNLDGIQIQPRFAFK